MEIQHYIRVFWRWKWLLIIATLLGAVVSYWVTITTPAVYLSVTTLSVGQFLQSDKVSGTEFTTTQQLAQAYALIARRQDVLESVIQTLRLPTTSGRLASQVNASAVPQTQLIRVSVIDSDPRRSQLIANAIAEALIRESPTGQQQLQDEEQRRFIIQQIDALRARIEDTESQIRQLEDRLARENSARSIQDLQTQIGVQQTRVTTFQGNYTRLLELARGSRLNFLTNVEPATLGSPVGSPLIVNVGAASMVGFLLAALVAIGLDFFDNRIATAEDAQKALDLPILGSISRASGIRHARQNLFTIHQPRSWPTESVRLLRSGLQWAGESNGELPSSIVITSPSPGEGKTLVACNLAVSFAQSGRSVILCDADMRLPSVHRYFDMPNSIGLSTLLSDPTIPVAGVLQAGPTPGLQVIVAGPTPENPGDLLGSEAFIQRVHELRDQADIVIIDTPAVLAVADASSVVGCADATLLVVMAGRTQEADARRAREMLDQSKARLAGIVMNRFGPRRHPAHEYYHSKARI